MRSGRGGSTRGRGGGRGGAKTAVTADDLDKELDAYIGKVRLLVLSTAFVVL